MYESESQRIVSGSIVQQQVEKMAASVSDNEMTILVTAGGVEAAYTAQEARELADTIELTAEQRWSHPADDIVEYLKELADVVDGKKEAEAVMEKWGEKTEEKVA
jgi:PHD/YefM family antitoxin component YafN of YafNO toxin-antitoxin module